MGKYAHSLSPLTHLGLTLITQSLERPEHSLAHIQGGPSLCLVSVSLVVELELETRSTTNKGRELVN